VTNIYYLKGLQQQEHPESICRAVMMRTLDYKLVRHPLGVSELYDLRTDPRELHNVYADPVYAAIRNQMEAGLLDWTIRTADVVPVGEDPCGLPREEGLAPDHNPALLRRRIVIRLKR